MGAEKEKPLVQKCPKCATGFISSNFPNLRNRKNQSLPTAYRKNSFFALWYQLCSIPTYPEWFTLEPTGMSLLDP
jgi:hypothetical protein